MALPHVLLARHLRLLVREECGTCPEHATVQSSAISTVAKTVQLRWDEF